MVKFHFRTVIWHMLYVKDRQTKDSIHSLVIPQGWLDYSAVTCLSSCFYLPSSFLSTVSFMSTQTCLYISVATLNFRHFLLNLWPTVAVITKASFPKLVFLGVCSIQNHTSVILVLNLLDFFVISKPFTVILKSLCIFNESSECFCQ